MSSTSAADADGNDRTARGRGKALVVIAGGSFLMIGIQMIYPVLLPELRDAYGIGLSTAGLLVTVLWLANAAGQLPGGMLADRIGENRTLVASTIVTGVTLVLIAVADTLAALFVATMLLGLGIALHGVARYTAMYDLFPDRAGTTIGIVLASSDAGQATLPPLAAFVAATVAWQAGFGFAIPLCLVASVALWRYVPTGTSGAGDGRDAPSLDGLRRVLSNMRTRPIGYGSAAFFVYMALWISFTSFYPTYLIENKGLASSVAAVLFGGFFAVGVVIKPLSGAAFDRVGIRRSLAVIAIVSGIALILLPSVQGLWPLALTTLAIAPILGTGTISQTYVINALSDDVKGTGFGVVRTGGMAIAAVSPTIFGAVAERGYFDEAFLSLSLLSGLLLLLVFLIPDE